MARRALLILIMLSALYPIPIEIGKRPRVIVRDFYHINVTLDKNGYINATLTLTYYNYIKDGLREIYFHIYPNSLYFRERGGEFKLLWVESEGIKLNYEIKGRDGSALEVKLPYPLPYGDRINISLGFIEKLPKMRDRYGMWKGIYALGNWYPIRAKLIGGYWDTRPYANIGEPFYSDVAIYEVNIKVPEGFLVGATGRLISVKRIGKWLMYSWLAENVRDFVWVASPYYLRLTKDVTVGGRKITLYCYCLPEHKEGGLRALRAADRALELFSKLIGEYLYPSFTICEVHAWFGGMEYPSLIMIASSLLKSKGKGLEIAIAHEVAHQWWGMMIGNDQGGEPWMDEAFAQYLTVIYFEKYYSKESKEVLDELIRIPYYNFIKSRPKADDRPYRSVWYFDSDVEYYIATVYDKGALVLRLLRALVGDEKFFTILRKVYEEYSLSIIKVRDFINLASEVSGTNLTGFFKDWLLSPGTASFSITNLSISTFKHKYLMKGDLIEVKGNKTFPLPVTLTFSSPRGEVRITVPFHYPLTPFKAELPFKPIKIIVDDDDLIPGKDGIYTYPGPLTKLASTVN